MGLDLEHRVGLQVLLHHAVDTNQQQTEFKLLPDTFTSLKLGKAGDNKKSLNFIIIWMNRISAGAATEFSQAGRNILGTKLFKEI